MNPDVLLALVNGGISASLNRHGAEHGLAPLAWSLSDSPHPAIEATHPDGRAHPDAELLCQQWADHLGIAEGIDTSGEGFRSWDATVGNVQFELHCITDVARYREIYDDAI